MRYCPNCGTELTEDVVFCQSCGTKIQAQTTEQPQVVYVQQPVVDKSTKIRGVTIASLCCGIACFFINPLYLTCLAAVVLGIVGLCMPGKKALAGVGIALGVVGFVVQFIIDIILSIFTMGASFLF